MIPKQNILIAPLDWGLGHTTRCVPIIRYLLKNGYQVFAAAEGASAQLLQENFPNLSILPLKGYHIEYSKTKSGFISKLLRQLPKIANTIKKEQKWLEQIVVKHNIDAVISDNRYGLYTSNAKNVILTHQVQILTGLGTIADAILRSLHRKMLERFGQCWIVDEASAPGLSGQLAHPKHLPKNAQYIGWLSQFEHLSQTETSQKDQHFLMLLSGPEPMRTQLEQLLWQQCRALTAFSFCFVAGKPDALPPEDIPAHTEWYSHLNAQALAKEILKAQGVVCRGGYTTLMDLQVLQRPALLIPTPGQTEQEYLARTLSHSDPRFLHIDQKEINLENDLAKILYLPETAKYKAYNSFYGKIIDEWLKF